MTAKSETEWRNELRLLAEAWKCKTSADKIKECRRIAGNYPEGRQLKAIEAQIKGYET